MCHKGQKLFMQWAMADERVARHWGLVTTLSCRHFSLLLCAAHTLSTIRTYAIIFPWSYIEYIQKIGRATDIKVGLFPFWIGWIWWKVCLVFCGVDRNMHNHCLPFPIYNIIQSNTALFPAWTKHISISFVPDLCSTTGALYMLGVVWIGIEAVVQWFSDVVMYLCTSLPVYQCRCGLSESAGLGPTTEQLSLCNPLCPILQVDTKNQGTPQCAMRNFYSRQGNVAEKEGQEKVLTFYYRFNNMSEPC